MTQNEARYEVLKLYEKSEHLRIHSAELMREALDLRLASQQLRNEAASVALKNPVRRAAERLRARLGQDGYDFTPPYALFAS